MKNMSLPSSVSPEVTKASIVIPFGDLDGEYLSKLMGFQEELVADMGSDSVVHTTMDAPNHPNRLLIEMEYLEEGYEDPKARTTISHTIANTKAGKPELIVVGADGEDSRQLINEIEDAMKADGLDLDIPVLVNGRLVQLVTTDFRELSRFGDAYVSFVATQVLTCQWGITPTWIQIVYADGNHRFPWEPGADKNCYQPVAARPNVFPGRGTADV